ncbi:hypothetical protein MHYP_G00362520 [Metynnis hypsauchen]
MDTADPQMMLCFSDKQPQCDIRIIKSHRMQSAHCPAAVVIYVLKSEEEVSQEVLVLQYNSTDLHSAASVTMN